MYCRACRRLLVEEDARTAERDDEKTVAIEKQREIDMRAQVVKEQERLRVERRLDYEPPRRIFSLRRDRSGERKRRTARRKRRGQCVRCGKPAISGRNSCGPCGKRRSKTRRVRNRTVQRRRIRARRMEKGICIECSQPSATGRRRCTRHLLLATKFVWKGQAAWSRKRRKEKTEFGECVECSEAADGDAIRCAKHKESARLAARARRAAAREKLLGTGKARRLRPDEFEAACV